MLNRRLLRIKAMQALYAFKQAKISDYHLAQEYIEQTFAPDLNSMLPQDKPGLEKNKKIALQVFEQSYESRQVVAHPESTAVIQEVVVKAMEQYYRNIEKDLQYFRQVMLREVATIYVNYLSILDLFSQLGRLAQQDKHKKTYQTIKVESDYKLAHNQLIVFLENNPLFNEQKALKKISWQHETELIQSLYQTLKKDDTYQQYAKLPKASLEEDYKILDYIVKEFIFKKISEEDPTQTGRWQAYWEERDLNWAENREILKSMVSKTLKNIQANDQEPFRLVELSQDWESDEGFFVDLYLQTIENENKYEQIIAQKALNWNTERLVMVDRVLLEMAMTEMICFANIPVKVTINEYIELSKQYSTPKSKIFINGLLDVIAEELKQRGEIKKSGRGLLDNR